MVPESDQKPNPGLDLITDSYAVVIDHATATDTVNASTFLSAPTIMECEVPADIAGFNGKYTSQTSTCENPADSPIKARKFQSQDSAQRNAFWDLRSSEATYHSNESQKMPQRINLHEAGLRRSPRLEENTAASSIKHKAHVTFGAILLKDVSLSNLLCNVNYYIPSIPAYHLIPNYSFNACAVHRFHELNKFYDGTVNHLHYLYFTTDVSINEVFTYHKAMKEADAELFVAAIKKEFSDP